MYFCDIIVSMTTNEKYLKPYEPNEVEKKIYKKWEESGFFNPDNLPGERKEKFSIVLPPPNVTGKLHIGHANMLAIEDTIVRFQRMIGKKTIISQTKSMGSSLDWSRLAFTLDDERNLAVKTAFKKMYEDGLIYQGEKVVNWDPKGQTVISDDEIVYEERKAILY